MNNTIEQQALEYARMVVNTGRRHLVFFPLRKSSRATTNIFRREVLRHLVPVHVPAIGTDKHYLFELEQAAKKAGYYIHEVNSADYDSKQYKREIARQLRKSGNSRTKVASRKPLTRAYTQPLFA